MSAKFGRMLLEPGAIGQDQSGCDSWHRSFVAVPEPIGFGKSRIIKFAIRPPMRLGVPIRETKRRAFSVIITRHMIGVVTVHVDAELGTTDAEGVDLPKQEEL